MGTVFISYRRSDSTKDARAVYERLRRDLNDHDVFIDLEGIDLGEEFATVIEKHLEGCDGLIVLIGKHWLGADQEDGDSRISSPNDFVRLEVATALRRGVRVFPVLLDGAHLPRAEHLPEELRPLLRRQTLELDYTRFDADVERLARAVRNALQRGQAGGTATASREATARHSGSGSTSASRSKSRTRMYAFGGSAAALITLIGVVYVNRPAATPVAPVSTPATPSAENPRGVESQLPASRSSGDAEYHAHHILVETESEAAQIIADLRTGKSFEQLARVHSKDRGSAPAGGDLGFARPEHLDPEFVEALTNMRIGEVSPSPVKTAFGYHVIRLDAVRPGSGPR